MKCDLNFDTNTASYNWSTAAARTAASARNIDEPLGSSAGKILSFFLMVFGFSCNVVHVSLIKL